MPLPKGQRLDSIELSANASHEIYVASLRSAGDGIGLAHAPVSCNEQQGSDMVVHMSPVALLLAVSINRNRLACKSLGDGEWNQFFGKLPRPEIIRCDGNNGGQIVAAREGSHPMVSRRFCSRIGRIGMVRAQRRERELEGPESAKDLIGRNVNEAKPPARARIEGCEIQTYLFEQSIGPYDICVDERGRIVERSINVALSGKVKHDLWLMLSKEFPDRPTVANISFDKKIAWVGCHFLKAAQISSIGESVQVHDLGSVAP